MKSNIQRKIKKLWRDEIKKNENLIKGDFLSNKGENLRTILKLVSSSNEKLVRKKLFNSLAVYEEYIEWFLSFHLWLLGKKDKKLAPACFLTGLACTQAIAIYRLVLSGLDTPARANLRNLFETIITCMVLLDNTDLGTEYLHEHKFSRFWHKHFSRRKLFDRHDQILRVLDFPEDVLNAYSIWVRKEYSFLSNSIHPSALAAIFTTHTKSLKNFRMRIGCIGEASAFSKITIRTACHIMFYFCQVGFFIMVSRKEYKSKGLFNINDKSFVKLVLKRNVLGKIMMSENRMFNFVK